MTTFPIPWEKALEGCRLSIENADRLAKDALLLKDKDRLQSAYSTSLDAWEELGKAVLLFRYWKEKQDISQADWFNILRDHRTKRAVWAQSMDILYPKPERPPKPVRQLKHDLEKVTTDKGWREWFKLERDIGIYVDWIGSGEHAHWRSPTKVTLRFPFDSEYWAFSVKSQCMHFREILPHYTGANCCRAPYCKA